MKRKACNITPDPTPINREPWRVYWPLGVERLNPYSLILGKDLRNRDAVQCWARDNVDPAERQSFDNAWLDFLIAAADARKRQQTSA